MKTKSTKALPKMSQPTVIPEMLPGIICLQWVRCGKSTCKCARGQLHGAYYYRMWREDGRLHKRYVRAADLKQTRAACHARRLAEKQLRVVKVADKRQFRKLISSVRESEALLTLLGKD